MMMENYRVTIEPDHRKWRWTIQKWWRSHERSLSGDGFWKVVQHGFDDPLTGKARTFEEAARVATAELGRIYAEQKRVALVGGYRQLGQVTVGG